MFSNEALYVVLQISNIFEKNKKLFIIVYLYISSFFQKMYPIFNKNFLRFCVTANFFMCNYWGGGKVRRKETKINNFPAKNLQKVPPFIPFKKAHYKKDKAFIFKKWKYIRKWEIWWEEWKNISASLCTICRPK